MKNVLTPVLAPALLATLLAVPAMAQVATPANPTGGNMDETPLESGTPVPLEGGQEVPLSTLNNELGAPPTEIQNTAVSTANVRVRMPSGELTEIPDSAETPWYRTEKMRGFTNFYFDPANRVYVVRGESNPSNWPKKNWDVE